MSCFCFLLIFSVNPVVYSKWPSKANSKICVIGSSHMRFYSMHLYPEAIWGLLFQHPTLHRWGTQLRPSSLLPRCLSPHFLILQGSCPDKENHWTRGMESFCPHLSLPGPDAPSNTVQTWVSGCCPGQSVMRTNNRPFKVVPKNWRQSPCLLDRTILSLTPISLARTNC